MRNAIAKMVTFFEEGDRILVVPTATSRHNGRKGIVTHVSPSRLYINFDGGNGKNKKGKLTRCWVYLQDAEKLENTSNATIKQEVKDLIQDLGNKIDDLILSSD